MRSKPQGRTRPSEQPWSGPEYASGPPSYIEAQRLRRTESNAVVRIMGRRSLTVLYAKAGRSHMSQYHRRPGTTSEVPPAKITGEGLREAARLFAYLLPYR